MRYKVLFGLALLIVSNVYGKITEVGSNSSSTPPGISTIQNKDEISSTEQKGFFAKMFEGIKNFFSSDKKSKEQPSASVVPVPVPTENKTTESIGTTFSSTEGDVPPISDTAQKLDNPSEEAPVVEGKSIVDSGMSSPQAENMEVNPADLTKAGDLNNENIQKVEVNEKTELGNIGQEEGIMPESEIQTPLTVSTTTTEISDGYPDLSYDSEHVIPTTESELLPTADEEYFIPEQLADENVSTDLHAMIPDNNLNTSSEEDVLQSAGVDTVIDNHKISENLPKLEVNEPFDLQTNQEIGFTPAEIETSIEGNNIIDESALISNSETPSAVSTTPLESIETPAFPVESLEDQLPDNNEMTTLPMMNQGIEESELGLSELERTNNEFEQGTEEFEGNDSLNSYENAIPVTENNISEQGENHLTEYEGM